MIGDILKSTQKYKYKICLVYNSKVIGEFFSSLINIDNFTELCKFLSCLFLCYFCFNLFFYCIGI